MFDIHSFLLSFYVLFDTLSSWFLVICVKIWTQILSVVCLIIIVVWPNNSKLKFWVWYV